jgi:leucyl/phenylalanyl-tRNA---protein transferase
MPDLPAGRFDAVDMDETLDGCPQVIGGELRPDTVLAAYQHGFFPLPTDSAEGARQNAEMYAGGLDDGQIPVMQTSSPWGPWALTWWNPAERPVLDAAGVRLSRTTKQFLRNRCGWTTTADQAFDEVVSACGEERASRWITAELAATLTQLHRDRWAHSVEVWEDGTLIAGIFGVAVGTVFSADSTFHRRDGAGKVAFADLGDRLRGSPCDLIDLQWPQQYLPSLGARWLDRAGFAAHLADVHRPVALPGDQRPARRLGFQ